jgi:hypothetical protein
MPPKHRQLHAPCPKASGNAYQALVDPPHDGNNPSFDRGDERTDGSDDNNVVNARPRDSEPTASQHFHQVVLPALDLYMSELHRQLVAISDGETMAHDDDRVRSDDCFAVLESKMDNLLQKMDVTWTENTALCEAYRASREETAMLKAAVDTLTKKLDENIAISAPPSPETTTTPSAVEEMMMQLSHVQHDIQDILDAVRNPPGKRKRCTSNQDNELKMPTNRQLATQRPREALPEHSLIHSRHATSATQEALDALMIKYPPRQLATASTSVKPIPPPAGLETQDTPLPDTPATAPVETDGWKTVEGKATQRKKKTEAVDKRRTDTAHEKTPMTKNGGRGKNSHQLRPNTTSTKKT